MRIAIVGSGVAGLGAAWLLDGTHDVLLFEKEPKLGGHADTVTIDACGGEPVDLGTQHLSMAMYPQVVRWFRHLGVPIRRTPVTSTFYDPRSGHLVPVSCRPSLAHTLRLCRPESAAMLMTLGLALQDARLVEQNKDWSTTVEDLVERSQIPRACKRRFLYPFLSAIAGAPVAATRSLSARAIFRYPLLHAPDHPFDQYQFLEVAGGLRTYIQRVASSLRTTTTKRNCSIRSVRKQGGKLVLEDASGTKYSVDRVIMAVPAYAAGQIVGDTPDGAALSAALQTFSYMRTVIAVHQDASRLPEDRRMWATATLVNDGAACEFTLIRKAQSGANLFKSWITHTSRPPSSPLVVKEYQHPLMDPAYFRAQRALERWQGKHGISFAGSYTQDIDSHESGLRSAIDVVQTIDPELPRLRLFTVARYGAAVHAATDPRAHDRAARHHDGVRHLSV